MSKEKYLSPLEELDLVLKEINGVVSAVEHTHNQPSNAEVLYEYFKGQNKFISKINLNRILIKLEKDTYISKNENGEYSVTWEGRLFIKEEGGYVKRKQRARTSTNLQLLTTWVIAGGAFFGLIWVCFQVYDWFHKCCPCHH